MFRYLLGRRAPVGRGALLLAVLVGWASSVWALGLGDIELDSALNEKLDAEIELLNPGGLQPTEVIVSLASADDFERVGVERFYFLTDLRFEVGYDGEGVRTIQVTSTQPVTEPYLNFLVEVLWPSGRLLKEYTLLLDPPTFSPAPAPSVSAPSRASAASGAAGQVERPGSASVSRGTNVQLAPGRQQQSSPLDQGVVDGEYRMTDRSDTLWSIAARTRPSDAVSVQQNMLAIQQLNPQAFLNGNINLLKAGYALRLPTEQQALATGSAEADQLVAQQNEDWRALQRGEPVPSRGEQQVAGTEQQPALQAQVDATPASERRQPQPSRQDGELRIVAGEGDGAAGISPVGAEELNASLEERDRLGREIDELTEELDRERELASNQIAVKDRQLEVKDQQIAEMQAQIAQLREEMAQVQSAPAGQNQNQNASDAEAWWQLPYVLGGAAGVVVLLLVYGLIAARRRRAVEDDDFYVEADDDTLVDHPQSTPAVTAAAATATAADAFAEDDVPAEQPLRGSGSADAPDATDSETGDVIGEADIYIAYGRYPQAIGLLLGVLEDDPNRNDVRLKLLELYAETRDREAFDAHLAELMARCEDDEALLTARELGAQFGDESAPAPAPAEDVLDVDDAVDLDELGATDSSDELELAELPPDGAERVDASTADDFELELDDLGEDVAASAGPDQPGDALGGDLGIDFDPEREHNGAGAADAPAALDAADDLDLDLDLDDAEVLGDDAFDFGDEGDTAGTKLDLARAYIDMGDQDGARDILSEVVAEGTPEQQQRAQAMLEEL